MQFTTLVAAVATLAVGTNAAAVPRDGARLAQFRVFGAEGCSALNYGFYTVDESDVGTCKDLANNPTPVISVHLEALYSGTCAVEIYSDANCSEGTKALTKDACSNPDTAGETWGSWKIVCGSS
ncbi:hypothetical protein F4777DRAFT_526303 [Nemania sp. FL0916]|nr:hypothetical protein F4777DRAFT_526303 [Nemania sp. FL0916]